MIEKRINSTKKVSWRARVQYKGRVIDTKTFTRKEDAENWHDRRLLEAKDPAAPTLARPEPSLPLGVHLMTYLDHRAKTYAGRTARTDRSLLCSTLAPLLHMDTNRITEKSISDVVEAYEAEHAPSSTRRLVASLSSFFRWCCRKRYMPANPADGIEVGPGRHGSRRSSQKPYDSMDEFLEVVADVRTYSQDAAELILTLGLTGLRWGEVRELRAMDVSEVPHLGINVRRSSPESEITREVTKGGQDRFIPLHALLHDLFRRRLDVSAPEDLLFTGPSGGKLQASNFRRDVRWKERSRGRRLHDLRHSACTFWVASGVELSTVMRWAGHAKLSTTVDLYVHSRGSDSDRAGLAAIERWSESHSRPSESGKEEIS